MSWTFFWMGTVGSLSRGFIGPAMILTLKVVDDNIYHRGIFYSNKENSRSDST